LCATVECLIPESRVEGSLLIRYENLLMSLKGEPPEVYR
jgi:hypothetical protein